MCKKVLAMYDVRGIQNYIYRTPHIKDAMGASIIIEDIIVNALEDLGIQTIDRKGKTRLELLDEIDHGKVIITAHGASQKVFDKAKAKGLEVIDASCLDVIKTHDLIQGKLYKIAYKEELHVYKPVICLLYVLRSGISSCYVASLSGYRNGVSHFKLICGNDIQFKLYQKLNSANYFDFMLECPDNSAGIMEIKAMIDLTVIETTEPLSDWQQIATK